MAVSDAASSAARAISANTTPSSVQALTRADLVDFHRKYFQPANMVAAVSGSFSRAVMVQKLEYLHHNPVARGLVAAPEHWRHSSAHEWCPGVTPLLRCDPWR